jgi:hypothetical protein
MVTSLPSGYDKDETTFAFLHRKWQGTLQPANYHKPIFIDGHQL